MISKWKRTSAGEQQDRVIRPGYRNMGGSIGESPVARRGRDAERRIPRTSQRKRPGRESSRRRDSPRIFEHAESHWRHIAAMTGTNTQSKTEIPSQNSSGVSRSGGEFNWLRHSLAMDRLSATDPDNFKPSGRDLHGYLTQEQTGLSAQSPTKKF